MHGWRYHTAPRQLEQAYDTFQDSIKRKQGANAANKSCSYIKDVLFDPDSMIGTGVPRSKELNVDLAVLALCQVVVRSWWGALCIM
jgi:hypothetical protein